MVAVDHGVAGLAKLAMDRGSVEAQDPLKLLAAEGHQAASDLAAITAQHPHGLMPLEPALHGPDAHRQQGGTAVDQGLGGAVIHLEGSLGQHRMGQPALAVPERGGAGMEQGADPLTSQQGLQHRRIPAIGQTHPHAAGGGDPGCGDLGTHSAGAPAAAAARATPDLLQFGEIAHLVDRTGLGVVAGITRIQAIDIGEQHQLLGADRHGHQGGEGVVVAETQLVGGEGVVLVHDRHHAPGQQLFEGAAGVLVAAAGGQVATGEQHLGHGQTADGESVLVESHQAPLAHGGGGLQSHHLAGSPLHAQGRAAESHGTAGHEGDGVTALASPGQAGRQVGDHRGGGAAGLAAQQAGAHLDHPPQAAAGLRQAFRAAAYGHPSTRAPNQRDMRISRLCTWSWGQGSPFGPIGRTSTVNSPRRLPASTSVKRRSPTRAI